MRLDGKNVIVTGAGSGIGKAIALMCASYGANISAADLNTAALEASGQEVEKLGRKYIGVSFYQCSSPKKSCQTRGNRRGSGVFRL